MNTPLQIGLIGFGNVGQGFYQLLKKANLNAVVKHICVKNVNKQRNAPKSLLTDDVSKVLNDPEIDVIIELIPDDIEAYIIATACFEKGIPLISANKKMIAEWLPQLLKWQTSPFYFEGAVAGGIPVVHNLKQYFQQRSISAIRAILNGSSNYILSQLFHTDSTLDEALNVAQEKGLVEADPLSDLSGKDAAYKLVILAYLAFGTIIDPKDIETESLEELSSEDIADAKRKGLKIKQIASLIKTEEGVKAKVLLTQIDNQDPMYTVDNEYNAVAITTEIIGDQLFYGKGAGSLPTGAAVLHDLQLIAEQKKSIQSYSTFRKKVA